MQMNRRFFEVGLAIGMAILNGCSSNGVKADRLDKQVLDTGAGGTTPSWVSDTKISWTEDSNLHRFKAFHSIKGDERLTACYELAKLNARETITSEIWSDFKAAVSHSTQGVSEAAEEILVQSRNLETRGNIRGLRFREAFHQRYLVNGVERIDCYVLGELSDNDYRKIKAHLLSPVVQANPELKKAIEENHRDFFRTTEPKAIEKREPSGIVPNLTTVPSSNSFETQETSQE